MLFAVFIVPHRKMKLKLPGPHAESLASVRPEPRKKSPGDNEQEKPVRSFGDRSGSGRNEPVPFSENEAKRGEQPERHKKKTIVQ
jgi:hypothetical protein